MSQSLSNSPINKIMFMEQIFQDINKQMLEKTYTLRLGQILKMVPNLKNYMWQNLKLEELNIAIKQILEPSVTIVVETHYELDTTSIKVDNQIVVIQIQMGKNIVEDVLIDGRASVNIIIENVKTKLSLPKPKLAPYHLTMVDQNMTTPLGIIRNSKIHIYGIPYIATFIVLKNNVVDSSYSMLLGKHWLNDAKVTHD